MARTRVKINRRTIGEYLNGEHGVEAVLEREAEQRLARAKSTAPVRSGAYRDSLHIETVHTDRMVKRVVADVPYALIIEADTGNLLRSL